MTRFQVFPFRRMGNSLRDALRQSGILATVKSTPDDATARPSRRPEGGSGPRHGNKLRDPKKNERQSPPKRSQEKRSQEEIDLAKAYALRAQAEQREKADKLKREREVAEQRRQQREQLTRLLDGKILNQENAEHPRHFEYGGKIRRVYVTEEQLERLNAGELAVVQSRGRYLLVERTIAEQVALIDERSVALLVDPESDQEVLAQGELA